MTWDQSETPTGQMKKKQFLSTKGGKNGRHQLIKFLLDPKIFNYVIMALYLLNAGRWAIAGSWKDVCYWLSALAITAAVTFMYEH